MAKAKQGIPSGWYVLAAESGGYLGTTWLGNSSGGLVCPRLAVHESLDPPGKPYHSIGLFHGKENAVAEANRAEQILPNGFYPVPVDITVSGKDAKIVERKA
jgi:hypothetical protein